jgi:hypothetical protein
MMVLGPERFEGETVGRLRGKLMLITMRVKIWESRMRLMVGFQSTAEFAGDRNDPEVWVAREDVVVL